MVLEDQASSLDPRWLQLPGTWCYLVIYFLSFLVCCMFHKKDFCTDGCPSLGCCNILLSKQGICIADNPGGCTSKIVASGWLHLHSDWWLLMFPCDRKIARGASEILFLEGVIPRSEDLWLNYSPPLTTSTLGFQILILKDQNITFSAPKISNIMY